jgi:poly-gamma-glutamate synthesis protein (capsule biosynthesis protein)
MFTRRLRTVEEPRFLSLMERVRGSDAAFLNLEAPIFEPSAYPVKQYVYTSYVTSEPWVAEELAWAGFNLASIANNHVSDWSPEVIAANRRRLGQAGIACSGAGDNLAEARAPTYLDTTAGRVGLISVDSSYEYGEFFHVQMAGEPHGEVRARPGTNGLRWDIGYELAPDDYDAFRAVYRRLGLDRQGLETAHTPPFPTATNFRFRGVEVELGERSRVRTSCRAQDLEEILGWVRSTREQVDVLIVSHHNHAAAGDRWELPAEFVREFARAAVGAGADVFVGHGYTLKGVEFRDGAVILYDVGDWALQDASARRHPGDAFARWGLDPAAPPGEFAAARERNRRRATFEDENRELTAAVDEYRLAATRSVLAEVEVDRGEVRSLKLVPCVLSSGPRHRRDTPLVAEGDEARAILDRVAGASAPFGTRIEVDRGIGTVTPPEP